VEAQPAAGGEGHAQPAPLAGSAAQPPRRRKGKAAAQPAAAEGAMGSVARDLREALPAVKG
jgi:hypothetical protein